MAATELSFPVKDLFPQEGWQKACEADPVLKPIYLMINGKDSKVVNLSLKQLKDGDADEPKFGLTALSVAAMTRNHDALKYLLKEKKVKPNPIDKAGLTPLHYACAIGDRDAMSELQKAMPQKPPKVQTVTQDIFQIFPGWKSMLSEPTLDKESEFFKQTNAFYCDAVVSDPKSFLLHLKDRLTGYRLNRSETNFNDELVRQFETREKEGDLLVLGKQEGADLGVFAKKDIKAGQIMGIFGGKLTYEENVKNLDYYLDHVDGSELRNIVDMLNDSFPNAAIVPVYLPDGRVYRCLIALYDIKKGKGIFFNYGFNHKIKMHERKELNLAEMETYFSENKIFDLCKFIHDHDSPNIKKMDLIIKLQGIAARLRYIFQTPQALIHLYLKGILTTDNLNFLQNESFLRYLEVGRFKFLGYFLEICRKNLLAFDSLRKSENDSIFFPDLETMGITILEKYSARVFLSIIALIIRNEEMLAKNWKLEKENVEQTAQAMNLLISRFVAPQKEKIDESYLKECKEAIKGLPPLYQSYIKEACVVIPGLENDFKAIFEPSP